MPDSKCLIVSLVPQKFLYTLVTAPLLFILVGNLCVCEFAMVPGVTSECVPRKKRYTVLPTHSAAQSSKRVKPLSVTIVLWQDHCSIGKQHKQQKKTNCLWCL